MASENLSTSFQNSNLPVSTVILELFPAQGEWREGDYFSLPGNRLVELLDGTVEVLPMPSIHHQLLSRSVFLMLNEFVVSRELGIAMTAPTRVRIADHRYREPDVLFISSSKLQLRQEQYLVGVDLVIEIISPDDPDRDLIDKRIDYAQAGISEYWIIDPRNSTVRVLELSAKTYQETNTDTCSITAESRVLPGFSVNVKQLFEHAR